MTNQSCSFFVAGLTYIPWTTARSSIWNLKHFAREQLWTELHYRVGNPQKHPTVTCKYHNLKDMFISTKNPPPKITLLNKLMLLMPDYEYQHVSSMYCIKSEHPTILSSINTLGHRDWSRKDTMTNRKTVRFLSSHHLVLVAKSKSAWCESLKHNNLGCSLRYVCVCSRSCNFHDVFPVFSRIHQ